MWEDPGGYEYCEVQIDDCYVWGRQCTDPDRVSPAGTLVVLEGVHAGELELEDTVDRSRAVDYENGLAPEEHALVHDGSVIDCRGATIRRSYSTLTVDKIRVATRTLTI